MRGKKNGHESPTRASVLVLTKRKAKLFPLSHSCQTHTKIGHVRQLLGYNKCRVYYIFNLEIFNFFNFFFLFQ